MRTGIIGRFARGTRHGYDRQSIKEPLASAFYDVRHRVSRALHAVDRNRILTGRALGYEPEGPPDFGFDRTKLTSPGNRYAIFLHATAQAQKQWPEENWIALGEILSSNGLEIVLPWGTDDERVRSERLAAALPGACVAERQPLDHVARLIAGAEFVVGVDTGLLHLAAALGVPLVAIFAGSQPSLTKPVGRGQAHRARRARRTAVAGRGERSQIGLKAVLHPVTGCLVDTNRGNPVGQPFHSLSRSKKTKPYQLVNMMREEFVAESGPAGD